MSYICFWRGNTKLNETNFGLFNFSNSSETSTPLFEQKPINKFNIINCSSGGKKRNIKLKSKQYYFYLIEEFYYRNFPEMQKHL